MPTIEISREQLAYVEALREEIEDEVPYGQVRNLDAVQYLIDHHREDGDLDIQIEGDLEADVEPEEAADGGTTVEPGDVGGEGAPGGDAGDEPGSADGGADDAGTGDPTPDPGSVAAAATSDDDDGGTTTRMSGGPDPSQLSGASGDDTLNEMMNLLEAHEDVWEEASGGEAKYQVELPDGEVEQAATKDDVRALLFKHYR